MTENLLSSKKLSLNIIWNLIGTGAPILAAIGAIPILIDGMGLERFGILTLAWVVVGYFSLFDLGLGRALTKLVAENIGQNDKDIPSAIWTAMWLMIILGVIGAITLALVTPSLVSDLLQIPNELQSEALLAFYLLAVSIPIVIVTTGLRGVLEAYQYFGLVNIVKVPLGIATFLGPVLVIPFSSSLVPIVGALVLARLLSLLAYAFLCVKAVPNLQHISTVDRELIGPLTRSGGWMTVSNIIGPLLVYADRLFIGAIATMTVVAYYSTPYEMAIKLLIVPGAFMGVMFPAFASTLVQNKDRAIYLFDRVCHYIFIALFPVVLLIVVFAHEGLTFWINADFADNSSLVLQLLVVGVFIISHAQVPFGMIQAAGRADLTAKLHLLELPLYFVVLWWLLGDYGIVGAATAWVVRVTFDTLCFFYISQRLLQSPLLSMYRLLFMLVVALFILVLGAFIPGVVVKSVYSFMVVLAFLMTAWFFIIGAEERNIITRKFRTVVGSS